MYGLVLHEMAPYKTRNTIILELSDPTLVIPNCFEWDLAGRLRARNRFTCTMISSGRILPHHDGTNRMKLEFWQAGEEVPTLVISVILPQYWTARIYLAILDHSIKRQGIIIVLPNVDVNGIQSLFYCQMEDLMNSLIEEGTILMI